MKTKEFIELVKMMRDAQKEYFKTRDRDVLVKSKALEARVDEIVKVSMKAYEEGGDE